MADSPLEISDHVVSLLSGDRGDVLSKNGRKFVQDNFQWTKSAEKLESILNELVTKDQTKKG